MTLVPDENGFSLTLGDTPIAQGWPVQISGDIPQAPSWAEAQAASADFIGFQGHPYPSCFVCGPDRAPGDGLRIFPGPSVDASLAMAPWQPDASLVNPEGEIGSEIIWAALDCPGAYAFVTPDHPAVLLGQLAASISGSVAVDEKCVVVGWEIAHKGRKHVTGAALFGEDARLVGRSEGTWIELTQ